MVKGLYKLLESTARQRVYWLLLTCMLLSSIPVFSKAIIYDVRDGLSSNAISSIAKDNRGLMWIGTFNGLNLYDGYTFTRFPGELGNIPITRLSLSPDKRRMLVGTQTGLYSVDLFSMVANKCTLVNDRTAFWLTEAVTDICLIPGRTEVYISFDKNVIAVLNDRNEMEMVQRINEEGKTVTDIAYLNGDNLLINNTTIYNLELKQRMLEHIPRFKTNTPYLSVSSFGEILLLNNQYSGLEMYDMRTMKDILPASLRSKDGRFPHRVQQSNFKNGKLYLLCANYSFFIADIHDGSLSMVSKKYPEIFEGKAYNAIFIDEHDIIWIATNKGLLKVEERVELFSKFLYNLPSRVSTRKMIEDDNGDIYVASYVGLWHYQQDSRSWTKYDLPPPAGSVTNTYPGPLRPLSLYTYPGSNYLYVGFDSEFLVRFDKRRKVYESFSYASSLDGEQLKAIHCMAADRNGILWLGCENGLASYDTAAQKLTFHSKDRFDIGHAKVKHIYAAENSDIVYVSASTGLYQLNGRRGIIKHYHTGSDPQLSSDDILFATEDPAGNIWIGTNGGGINILSADGSSVRQIRKQHGLSNEVVYSIVMEDERTFWISTFNGLDRYRSDLQSFSNFFEEDGISSDEFNQNSSLRTRKGEMLFGSINGITSINPQQLSQPTPFRLFFSGISRWNHQSQAQALFREHIDAQTTIIKRPADQLMELHFGCTDYSDPLRNSYSYRIRQLSDKWVSLDDRHTFNLSTLPYGKFNIEVKAINSRGASSSNILQFQVELVQPFYKTWWFYTAILVFIAIVFYIAYWIKYQNFKNVLKLRMRIASNLHDEVGSLLTRITMFTENLRYGRNTDQQRNAKLEKIALLSRDAVASMSDVLWTIDSRNDFAGNLLDRFREHTEEMLFPLGIDVNFVISGTDFKQPVSSDTRGEIYLIFKEAINNIAKHSKATYVDINCRINDKKYLIRITNNGAGAEANEFSTGQGLSNMQMRAKRIKAIVEVTRAGDTFSVEIRN
jgi:ligand-binding sensor domain-containing protein/two-component sensor histidine kinase